MMKKYPLNFHDILVYKSNYDPFKIVYCLTPNYILEEFKIDFKEILKYPYFDFDQLDKVVCEVNINWSQKGYFVQDNPFYKEKY
jgi:hypothetical protein